MSSHRSAFDPSTSGTGIMVGSRALWIAPGSPPESTASRASSSTGAGGEIMSSSISFSLRLVDGRRILERVGGVELKGTRNLKHDQRSRATSGLTELACWGGPRRESKSETVALGLADDGGEREIEDLTGLSFLTD